MQSITDSGMSTLASLNKDFMESNASSLDSLVFALCKTYLDDSIDSGNFFMTGYLPLIQADSIIHMHGLAVYVKEGLPAWDLSLANYDLCF